MYRKLSEDVDATTMQTMREGGMSNRQIAERLGVSMVTVRKYIGKQPTGLRMPPGSYLYSRESGLEIKPEQVIKPSVSPILRVISTRSTLKGDCNDYVIDTSNGTVEISGLVSGILDASTIRRFAKELDEIMSIFKNIDDQRGVA